MTICGIALVISQGCLVLFVQATSFNLNSLLEGAGIGISGMLLLVVALQGKLDLFPAGAAGFEIAKLQRRAVGYLVTGAILVIVLIAAGIFAITGAISSTLGVVVMWTCFSATLTMIAMLGLIKRRADRIAELLDQATPRPPQRHGGNA
jgi:hypothetical protein